MVRPRFAVVLLGSWLFALPAAAQDVAATLQLDAWSSVRFGSDEALNLPPGTNIPLVVTPTGPGVGTVRVAEGLTLPPLPYSQGRSLVYSIESEGAGAVQRVGTHLVLVIATSIRSSNPSDPSDGRNYSVSFVSQTPDSGAPANYVRLLATTANASDVEPAPSTPVEANLSGIVTGLPF